MPSDKNRDIEVTINVKNLKSVKALVAKVKWLKQQRDDLRKEVGAKAQRIAELKQERDDLRIIIDNEQTQNSVDFEKVQGERDKAIRQRDIWMADALKRKRKPEMRVTGEREPDTDNTTFNASAHGDGNAMGARPMDVPDRHSTTAEFFDKIQELGRDIPDPVCDEDDEL